LAQPGELLVIEADSGLCEAAERNLQQHAAKILQNLTLNFTLKAATSNAPSTQ
jgi:hypothetical protein